MTFFFFLLILMMKSSKKLYITSLLFFLLKCQIAFIYLHFWSEKFVFLVHCYDLLIFDFSEKANVWA